MIDPLQQLSQYGQAYWIDNLTRRMIKSGELYMRVTAHNLRGVTSNPAIFHKAIAGSNDYDAQIQQLVHEGLSIHEVYERLIVSDIQEACDILRPVYDDTDAMDGYVSLEVSPYLAHDTEGTMQEVRWLWGAVNRPNLFIKIPGTSAGVPAIEQMLSEGININITLLFSVRAYEAVAHAYIRALERRVAESKPVRQVASVASFFLSRIDVLVDQLLGHRIRPSAIHGDTPRPEQLLGKVAIANAKLAYQSFQKIFSGPRWEVLAAQGARVQRPLWASTSTKDPLYQDVRYVEPLIGPYTVNTMPDETIDAFADHGVVEPATVEADLEEVQRVFSDLQQVGVDFDCVAWQLENEGVQKFIEPFDQLMKTLADKRQKFLGAQASRQAMALGQLKSPVTAAFRALDSRQFGRRLFAPDPFLWTDDAQQADAIRHHLGWLYSVEAFRGRAAAIAQFATEITEAHFSHVVLLAMGELSLFPAVCRDTFGVPPGWPQLLVLDNADAATMREVEAYIDLARTLFIVASKSGTIAEISPFFRHFRDRLQPPMVGKAGDHFVAITDSGTALAEEARRHGFRHCFENPPDIGSRYSALSYFGLVPTALLGVDIATFLERAHQMWVSCGPFIPAEANPGVSLGALLGMAARQGRHQVTLVSSQSLGAFSAWVGQLLAVITGKEGRGLVPVVHEPLGTPDVYGADRVFVSFRLAKDEEVATDKRLAALEEAGQPVVRIIMPETIDLGAECFRWEVATATAGAIVGANPC
jgi:transaldolase / glucose-6-phosphate isomerase